MFNTICRAEFQLYPLTQISFDQVDGGFGFSDTEIFFFNSKLYLELNINILFIHQL